MVDKFKKKLKKYASMSFNEKRNVVGVNIEKVKKIVQNLRNNNHNQHPQHKIEKYEGWDW